MNVYAKVKLLHVLCLDTNQHALITSECCFLHSFNYTDSVLTLHLFFKCLLNVFWMCIDFSVGKFSALFESQLLLAVYSNYSSWAFPPLTIISHDRCCKSMILEHNGAIGKNFICLTKNEKLQCANKMYVLYFSQKFRDKR